MHHSLVHLFRHRVVRGFGARALIAVALSLVTLAAGPLSASDFIRGEVNGDDEMDISDPIRILVVLFFAGQEFECDDSADVNDDGVLNIADPARLLMYLFQNGAPPTAPYPGRGPDPTPDPLCCADSCNPDLDGVWSGTFYPEGDGEYVVSFEVVDAPRGTLIRSGLESLGNVVLGGEIVILEGTGDRLLAFRYDTSFDSVAGEFTLSPDGQLMENGAFATTSGTEGTFSMRRVGAGAFPKLGDGDHSIVFVTTDDSAAWGGRLTLASDGCVETGNLSAVPLVPESSKIQRWAHDPADEENSLPGVYTGALLDERGYAVNLLGLLGADELLLHGLFTDSFGSRGVFLVAPAGPAAAP